MPTRKQRRRELKSKRHEYEFVYVDDDGNEVEAPAEEAEPKQKAAKAAAPAKKQQPQRRSARAPQPPSWSRAAKRSAIFGAFALVFISFSAKGNILAVLPVALGFAVLYTPGLYWMDRMIWRRYQARQAGTSRKS